MGTSTVNWRGIVHRTAGALVGVSARVHFGDYSIDIGEAPEMSPADASTVKAQAAQSVAAMVSAIGSTAWASWWTGAQSAFTAAGAPAGSLGAAARDWFLDPGV